MWPLHSSNRRHLWFTNTHTTSTYFYVFLMTVIFFEVLSVISSINASGFGMELRQTIFFSFDEDLTSSST